MMTLCWEGFRGDGLEIAASCLFSSVVILGQRPKTVKVKDLENPLESSRRILLFFYGSWMPDSVFGLLKSLRFRRE